MFASILKIGAGLVSLVTTLVGLVNKRSDQATGATLQAETDKAAVADVAQTRVAAEVAVGQETTDQLRAEVAAQGQKP